MRSIGFGPSSSIGLVIDRYEDNRDANLQSAKEKAMSEEQRTYPRTIEVAEKEIVLAPMGEDDAAAVLEFARGLSSHDLLFMRRQITQEADVRAWIDEIDSGAVTTLLARCGDSIVGYTTIDRSRLPWSRHVAELRVVVAESMRGLGLGRALTQEAFAFSLSIGIEKMVARMTLDQKGAISVFEGLGFRPEALLRDHVKDGAGEKHDLVVMSHDVSEFETTLESYGLAEALT